MPERGGSPLGWHSVNANNAAKRMQFHGHDTALKSGTNSLYGYEFIRNQVTDAKPYFTALGVSTPAFKQNTFGGTIGPHLKRSQLLLRLRRPAHPPSRQRAGHRAHARHALRVPSAPARSSTTEAPCPHANYSRHHQLQPRNRARKLPTHNYAFQKAATKA